MRAIVLSFKNYWWGKLIIALGFLALVQPTATHQVALKLIEDQPPAFVMEPPGLHLHLWHETTGLVTHTKSRWNTPVFRRRMAMRP